MSTFARTMTVICAVGAGTAAGVFFAFSTFVMKALEHLPPADGAAAMQSINKEAPNPLFMLVLFGTGAACVVLGVHAALNLGDTVAAYQLIGCALYVVGAIVLTGAYHIPRNNRLDGLDATSAEGMAYWATFVKEWTRANHLRTLLPLAAATVLTVSLRVGS